MIKRIMSSLSEGKEFDREQFKMRKSKMRFLSVLFSKNRGENFNSMKKL